MYTREISAPRISPVEDGNPLIGTWNRAFEKVDLLEIRKPYRVYLPRWFRNLRIKEWVTFCVQDENYLLEAFFCNVKLHRAVQVLFYDKKNDEKYFFNKIMPGAGWSLPKTLTNSSLDNHSSRFYFRIHNWLDADTVQLDINIEASRRRPSLTAHLVYDLNSRAVTPMTVSLGISERRIMYAYKTLAPVQGDVVFNGQHINFNRENCSGFFCDNKGFFPYRMFTKICSAMGFDKTGRRFGFHIAENQAKDTNKNNENALWVNGQLTLLPPVLITMSDGPHAEWVIQDIEGMVDLTFSPKEQNKSGMKLIFSNVEYNKPFGYYNGVLVNSEGEKIQIKNLFGTGEVLNIRV